MMQIDDEVYMAAVIVGAIAVAWFLIAAVDSALG